MVLLEPMSAGLVAVAFDGLTRPGEVIDDGVNGLLVPPGDLDALAVALIEVIQDPDRRRLFRKALRSSCSVGAMINLSRAGCSRRAVIWSSL